MAIDKFNSPNLPIAPNTYDPGYFNQLIRAIGIFFKVIDSKAGMTVDSVTTHALFTQYVDLTLTNGVNDNIKIPLYTFLRIVGPTSSFDVRGFDSSPQNNNNGRHLILFNSTSQNMTIHDEESTIPAANRISTMTGTNINISGKGIVSFIYSVADLRWLVISHQG